MSTTRSLENGHYLSPASSTRSSPARSSPSNVNLKKANEDLKRRINKLRADLESEKHRSKMVHKEKVQEVKAVRDQLEREKDRAVEQVSLKLLSEKHLELQRLRENLAREKDQELKQVLQYKEEELKQIHGKLLQQYEESVRLAQENTRKQVANQVQGATSELEKRLMQEIKSLKEAKERAEQLYELKCRSDSDKAEDIKRLKSHYETEIKRILQPVKDDKKDLSNMQSVKRAMKLKDQEIIDKENTAKKLQQEKNALQAELQKYKDSEKTGNQSSRSSVGPEPVVGSPSLSSTPKRAFQLDDTDSSADNSTKKLYEEKEKSLLRKNSELQSQVQRLEKRVTALKTDNDTLKSREGTPGPSQDIDHYKRCLLGSERRI
ncbi:janus kinase and microtubule-interacting protein 2-like isoform X2 [Ptychodera flava]|uniref:janus kinase and microtubule-interacting protein 2-like isoform X2 n=1 Tax=Ptychodera flava TaxID=63121 RepID=UPI00396AACD5